MIMQNRRCEGDIPKWGCCSTQRSDYWVQLGCKAGIMDLHEGAPWQSNPKCVACLWESLAKHQGRYHTWPSCRSYQEGNWRQWHICKGQAWIVAWSEICQWEAKSGLRISKLMQPNLMLHTHVAIFIMMAGFSIWFATAQTSQLLRALVLCCQRQTIMRSLSPVDRNTYETMNHFWGVKTGPGVRNEPCCITCNCAKRFLANWNSSFVFSCLIQKIRDSSSVTICLPSGFLKYIQTWNAT